MTRVTIGALIAVVVIGCGDGTTASSPPGADLEVATASVGASGTPEVCIPGEQIECACVGGSKGAQACLPSGTGYGGCLGCPSGTGGTGGIGGSGASGGTGSTSVGTGGAAAASVGTASASVSSSSSVSVAAASSSTSASSSASSGGGGGSPICGSCDDGDVCTADACMVGVCAHTLVQVDDGNACTTDACDPVSGVSHVPIPVDDGNVCTIDSCNQQSGQIAHAPVNIDDNNGCTVDSCDPAKGVLHVPVPVDDGNVCTLDVCVPATGSVTHPPAPTDDGNACTTDACDPQVGFTHVPVPFDDNDACTSDGCNPNSGPSHVANWSTDWNPCTADTCDPASGKVSRPIVHDCWAPIASAGAPSARGQHVAVWTGSTMIVWGGLASGNPTNTGSVYDPVQNAWTATWSIGAPTDGWGGVAVWFASRMVIMGGFESGYPFFTGAWLYDHSSLAWSEMSGAGGQPLGWQASAAIVGPKLIFWGGSDGNGARSNGWSFPDTTPGINGNAITNAPVGRFRHSLISTGSEMIVYGGLTGSGLFAEGGHRYTPTTDSWSVIPAEAPPMYPFRSEHVGAWTGSHMLVWGGKVATTGAGAQQSISGDGSAFDPAANAWATMSGANAPTPRFGATGTWTGSKWLIWGGDASNGGPFLGTGGVYDAASDVWKPISNVNAPSPRDSHTAVWTGIGMIIWGGESQSAGSSLGDGAIYYP